ncbi:IS3 family transposase [Corynebacterium hansenii]|uniref:IS3 family transposase n=1 Tax=Corynebacterium hansenii TaxID=394964 RepID=A0ABV7ZND7_9CORY
MIQDAYDGNHSRYGVRKLRKSIIREYDDQFSPVASNTVERLMRQ